MDFCKTCGGTVSRKGNFYVCEYCMNKWEIDSGNDVHAVDRANAWRLLRDGDFEKSAELFESIILKEEKNHEAYWGYALANAGIVYVTDMNENKKVPTCNNITEDSFIKNKNVQKAINLAPDDIAANYKQQAEYIEKVRIEWLEKARKEPEYDVFISFKDSDRENGIERTQDSIDAQDLYNALISEGYKVFFSRISLRDKISEQYEPYIYNAIKTSKVMIVFGEKAEYFNSVWIKNEWSRFKRRIENGEKHKNSLVAVYKNMSPAELPIVLKSRQCLNAADMTFLSDLTRHIKRVIDESQMNLHLKKVEISGGQISKKASKITINQIQMQSIGNLGTIETSINETQTLKVINSMITRNQWDTAISMANELIFDNPTLAEANLYKFLAEHRITDIKFLNKQQLTDQDMLAIEKILNYASKDFAASLLDNLYLFELSVSDDSYCRILTTILPYGYENRDAQISQAFKSTIQHSRYQSFLLLLNTLNSDSVDTYIKHNLKFAHSCNDYAQKIECANRVLSVDEGNSSARKILFGVFVEKHYTNQILPSFEQVLRYSNNISSDVIWAINTAIAHSKSPDDFTLIQKIAQYYPGNQQELCSHFNKAVTLALKNGWFPQAEELSRLTISLNPTYDMAYLTLCYAKAKIKLNADAKPIVNSLSAQCMIIDMPEFHKCLTLTSDDRRNQFMEIAKQQSDYLKKEESSLIKALALPVKTSYIIIDLLLTVGFALLAILCFPKSALTDLRDLFDNPASYMSALASIFGACMVLYGVFGRLIPDFAVLSRYNKARKEGEAQLKAIQRIINSAKNNKA